MLVPFKWLKDYVDITQTPEELAALFNMHILEVESLKNPGKEIKGVIVAQIKEVEKHPKADKLHVLKVDTGTETLQIVCGAANVAPNVKIALGLVDAELPGGMKLRRAKIRDVESFGMCCSEKELGLAAESQGIIHLPADAPLGQDIVTCLGLDNAVFDLAILPNRGDLQSIRAVAVEVAAVTGAKLKLPLIERNHHLGTKTKVDIKIEDPTLCGRYMGAILNVKVESSPQWLQDKLKSIGLKSINNIVDITNFVLYELGQPLHAFDYAKLKGGKIIVRKAKPGEKIVTLDAKLCELNEKNLVICDAEKPVAIAGIMGGADSAVDANTKTILLESAWFNPVSIRNTSKTKAIRSDSSMRFEKSVSFDGVEDGFYRAIQLFKDVAHGELISDLVDQAPGRKDSLKVNLAVPRVNKLLGTDLSEDKIVQILSGLQFKLEKKGQDFEVTIPSARLHDVYREADLIEEVARIIGYNHIKSAPLPLVVENKTKDTSNEVELIVRNILRSAGLNDVKHYSMTSPDIYKTIGLADQFKDKVIISNPLSVEESVMRQSLLPQLIKALEFNLAQQADQVAMFEIGKVYFQNKETVMCSGVIYGNLEEGALGKSLPADFYYLKGIWENIYEASGLKIKKAERANSVFVHPGKSLEWKPLGILGELSPLIAQKLGLLQPAYVFEFDLDQLMKMASFKKVFTEISSFPSAVRDMAFLIDQNTSAFEVEKVIKNASPELVEKSEIFDRYLGKNIPEGQVSLAYSITYRAKDRTLKEDEINKTHEQIKAQLQEKLKVSFR